MKILSFKDVGPPNTPQEIKRLRYQNLGSCKHLGAPVVWRHAYGLQDLDSGVAKRCPACYSTTYKQGRSDCPVCYGTALVSVEDNPETFWIDSDGLIIEAGSQPAGTVRAPRFGGFAIPYLTWLVEPDVKVDTFRLNEQGALVQQYDAKAFAPWTPTMGDNDLLINVSLGLSGYDVVGTHDRFTLKQVAQVTSRGLGKRGVPKPLGQPFLVMQSFEMNKVAINHPFNAVPVDEPWYGTD